jgi:hypothetical protein
MVLAQNRYTDQWNRIEDPEISLSSYSFFLTKVPKPYIGKKPKKQPL